MIVNGLRKTLHKVYTRKVEDGQKELVVRSSLGLGWEFRDSGITGIHTLLN